MGEVAVIDQSARPNLVAGGRLAAIIPQTMDEAYRMAKAVCLAGMAPRGMDTPEKAMIAIMRGMEVGLTPFQALDKIAVVNGRPTIWGDGAMALVRGSGICEWVKETIEGDGDARVAICEAKRRGDPTTTRRTFSVADAKKAGLWGKQGPWQQYPERMLAMRARAFCLRDLFADVLGGLYLREEIDDAPRDPPPAKRIPPPAPKPPESLAPPAATAKEPEAPAADLVGQSAVGVEASTDKLARRSPPIAPPPEPKTVGEAIALADKAKAANTFPPVYSKDAGGWFKWWQTRAEAAPDIDALIAAWDVVEALDGEISPEDYNDCQAIYRRCEERLAP